MSTKVNLNLFKVEGEELTIRQWIRLKMLKKELIELYLLIVGIFSIGLLGIMIWSSWK